MDKPNRLLNPLTNKMCVPTVAIMKKIVDAFEYPDIPGEWITVCQTKRIQFKYPVDYIDATRFSPFFESDDLTIHLDNTSTWLYYIVVGTEEKTGAWIKRELKDYCPNGYCTSFTKVATYPDGRVMYKGSRSKSCD